jgi:hypothetical protein
MWKLFMAGGLVLLGLGFWGFIVWLLLHFIFKYW